MSYFAAWYKVCNKKRMGILSKQHNQLLDKMMQEFIKNNPTASDNEFGDYFDRIYDMKLPVLEATYKRILVQRATKGKQRKMKK